MKFSQGLAKRLFNERSIVLLGGIGAGLNGYVTGKGALAIALSYGASLPVAISLSLVFAAVAAVAPIYTSFWLARELGQSGATDDVKSIGHPSQNVTPRQPSVHRALDRVGPKA